MPVFNNLQQGILCSNGAVEVEECNTPAHSFIFLNMNSGMLLMMSMIQRQNHFT